MDQIKANKQLTEKEKQIKVAALQRKLDSLSQRIDALDQQHVAKEKAQQINEEQERLNQITDPETAEIMLQLEQAMQTVVEGQTEPIEAIESQTKMITNAKANKLADEKPEMAENKAQPSTVEELQEAIIDRTDKGYTYEEELKGYFVDETK
ncbi:hypothetical protein lbkm_3648 [Lachnospiraceae bacterium KM106-2]|nr:hypothetical protein lbkm_3648 [Lachnospiraceae bacterium KM106-2]